MGRSVVRLVAALAALAGFAAADAAAMTISVKNCTAARFEARAYRSDDEVLFVASSAMSADPGYFASVNCPTDRCKLAIAPVNAFVTVLNGTYVDEICIVREGGNITGAAMSGGRCQPPQC